MKVLLGWELGAGQGHIQRLVALAQRLTLYGCVPVFALKSQNLKGMDFPYQSVAAPRLPFSGREDSHTFADILATFGFNQADLLSTHLQNWQAIIKSINPDLVITDHAPGLVLAAKGRVPVVVIGSHFAVPPPVEVFPPFRFPAPPESAERQMRVSETVRQVVGLDTPLGQVFNGDRSFIFSIPELDCYRAWRQPAQNDQYVGIHVAPLPRRNGSTTGKNWTYLASDYRFRDLVFSMVGTEPEFKPLQEALIDKSIAIHHGGLTTAIACLLAGIPQLILPRYIEQQLNAIALSKLEVAQMLIAPTFENLQIAQTQVSHLSGNALRLAEQLFDWNQNFLDRIVADCLQYGSCQSIT